MNTKLLIPIRENTKKDYFIYIDHNFQEGWIDKIRNKKFTNLYIITDKNVYKIYKDFLNSLTQKLNIKKIIILKPGEKNKHLKKTFSVYENFIKSGIDRKSGILAIGGGVVGDFSGFIASTILRGVPFIQIPTTLLSMVDSSVGGKVAVNIDVGKNMIGAFYQPIAVFCNIDFLKTLPDREWLCGLTEMFKHSLLDKKVYKTLKETILNNPDYKKWDNDIWKELIYQSISVKAKVVSKDEKEKNLRSILNLGHTIGHALESLTHYKKFSHGEAVSRGLVTALLLSKKKYNLSEKQFKEIINLMMLLKLPLNTAGFYDKQIWTHLQYDKKNQSNKIKYIYLKEIGKPIYDSELFWEDFQFAWKEQKALFG